MKNKAKEESLNSEEILEENEKEETIEKIPNVITEKYTRPPVFQKSGNNLGKGNFQTNNNRQRPGRAAGRGR